ncbi:hypothetical protein O181_005447 [Austropuccinia psidii MF-1]|uniref:Uncharacterized protein n=1 Tax=Austropuccinia psidii MF-1 TaxID=1389203 RepID=A0A9Q3GGP2_9BASI|nr:hypothetical protein [Austropuccinia psidii MF-1]
MFISTFYQVIKESHHPEDSSRLKDKCQTQVPMIPSSNHWLFSFTVFLQGNTVSSFSKDIQEAVPKQFSKGQCSINSLGNHIHSIQSGFIKTCISTIHHGNFIPPSSFPNLARYKLHQGFHKASRIQYRPAVSLKESISQLLTFTNLL